MRIIEVRDGFIKFESNENKDLSSFIEIMDKDASYIAQIVQTKNFEDKYINLAKILYNYDGSFRGFSGTSPRREALIKDFRFEDLNNSFNIEKPFFIGCFSNTNSKVIIDRNSFNKKMLISFEDPKNANFLLSNITREFNKGSNIIIIDMLGLVDSSAKSKASIDFKIPLNRETLDFLYEDCLNDATSDSKNLVKEIFQDLADYSKTVDFLPFRTLKTIIDEMVEKSHIFKLLVLKNKLTKFDKAGFFANKLEEFSNIEKLFNKKTSVLDLSKLDTHFQNRYLTTIFNEIKKSNFSGQVLLIASNSISKNNIKTILTSTQISTTFVVHSRFKYLNDFKSLFTNYLIEPCFANNEIFKTYSMYLNNMQKNKFLLVGECDSFIPLIIEQRELEEESPFDDVIEIENNDEELNAIAFEEPVKDTQTIAIEKKSKDLIEKLSEEDLQPEIVSIFSEEEDLEAPIDTEEKEDNKEPDAVSETEDSGDSTRESFRDSTSFHTIVDSNKISNIMEDTSINTEDEIIEEIINDDEELVEVTNDPQNDNIELKPEVEAEDIKVHEPEIEEDILDLQSVDNASDEFQEIEVPENLSEELEEIENIEDDTTVSIINEELEQDENSTVETIEQTVEEYIETEILPTEQDELIEEIIELDDIESDDDIVVEIEDFQEDELNKEIIEDVDRVYTTIKEDTLSDSDLDFIDELNSEIEPLPNSDTVEDEILEEVAITEEPEELEELREYKDDIDEDVDFLEPIEEINLNDRLEKKGVLETKNTSTPIVPIYDAEIPQEDLVSSDDIEQGDTVTHAKYGTGVVEKMIKYGAKTLYSINFDNVGRRLLDPTLTEIKKS